eukprot:4582-Prorocentrum_minimum.AAC.5
MEGRASKRDLPLGRDMRAIWPPVPGSPARARVSRPKDTLGHLAMAGREPRVLAFRVYDFSF